VSNVILRFDNLGSRNDGTAAVSGGTPIRALGSTTGNPHRQAINIRNHSSTDGIRVYLTQSDTAPTISSTSNDVRIPPNDSRTISAAGGIRCWLLSDSASNTCAFTALELL
jgi:hypothetical protein